MDDAIQRVSELLLAVPKLPLWPALAAAVPRDMPTMERYVLIVMAADRDGITGATHIHV